VTRAALEAERFLAQYGTQQQQQAAE